MKKKGAPVVMVLPKEGSGYEMEANGLTKKGAKNPAAKQFLDWAITDEAMALYAKYFAAVGVAGFPVPEGLPSGRSATPSSSIRLAAVASLPPSSCPLLLGRKGQGEGGARRRRHGPVSL